MKMFDVHNQPAPLTASKLLAADARVLPALLSAGGSGRDHIDKLKAGQSWGKGSPFSVLLTYLFTRALFLP